MSRLLPWALAISLALCAAWLVYRAWTVESDAARAAEDRRLTAAGQITEAERTAKEIETSKAALIISNEALRLALEAAYKAAPGATVTRVVRASTGPVPIDPETMRAFCESLHPSGEANSGAGETKPAPDETIEGEIRVAEVDLKAKEGTITVNGAAGCYRVKPLPVVKLFDAKFDAKATSVEALATSPPAERLPWWVHEAIGAGVGLAAGIYLGSR